MVLPDYQKPFDPDDFRGYFQWKKNLTRKLPEEALYHACHFSELKKIIKKNKLSLRSSWSIDLPEHGVCEVPGVWCGLNFFIDGNYYGPFLIEFSLSVLEGKQFMAFRRGRETERLRYFFVQYDSMIPTFSYKGKKWRRVKAEKYFDENINNSIEKKSGAIYDILLTTPISLDDNVSISSVNHPKCISGKCNGVSRKKSQKKLIKLATKLVKKELYDTDIIEKAIVKYPDIEGEIIDLELE